MPFISRLIATGFYLGYIPFAPGTIGSLLGLALFLIFPNSTSWPFIFPIAILFAAGVWASQRMEAETKTKDDQRIVIDEVVGMLLAVYLFEKQVAWLIVAFILFRFFDIIKPFPASHSERLPHGWGVMMDDVIAGIYSAVTLRMIHLAVSKVL